MTIPTIIYVIDDMDVSEFHDEDYCRWEMTAQCCSEESSRPSYPTRRGSIQTPQQPVMRRTDSYDSGCSKKTLAPSVPTRRTSIIIEASSTQYKLDSRPQYPMRRQSVQRVPKKYTRAAIAA